MHKRPLLNPDEIGRLLARIDDERRPGYPGLVLALVPGEHPLLARRINYFEAPEFLGYFDPHPDHPPPPTLAELPKEGKRKAAAGSQRASVGTFRRWWRIGSGLFNLVLGPVMFVTGVMLAGTNEPPIFVA